MDTINTMEMFELPKSASQRRVGKLRALLDGLARNEMDLEAIALLLGCSASSARNYTLELLDAELITFTRGGPVRGRVASAIYRLKRPESRQSDDHDLPAKPPTAPRDPLVMALFGGNSQAAG